MATLPATPFKAVFHYPVEFTSLPEYSQHRGMTVRVDRELTADEYDNEGECMYQVTADDGWIGHAWESELQPIDPQV